MLREILKAREERWERRCQLVKKYKSPLITITLNIPGPEKIKETYLRVHQKVSKEFCQYLNAQGYVSYLEENRVAADGPETYLTIIGDYPILELKKIAIEFENSFPLGRLVDIDVMDEAQNIISRKDIGRTERECLLCNATARECILTRKHSLDLLLNRIEQIIKTSLD